MIEGDEYLEFRGLITRVERIMSALLNLNDQRDWQAARVERLRKQMDHLNLLAGKLAEALQQKMIDEAVTFKRTTHV